MLYEINAKNVTDFLFHLSNYESFYYICLGSYFYVGPPGLGKSPVRLVFLNYYGLKYNYESTGFLYLCQSTTYDVNYKLLRAETEIMRIEGNSILHKDNTPRSLLNLIDRETRWISGDETTLNDIFLTSCEYDNIPAVSQCLSLGADVNFRGLDGRTGLHSSVYRNRRVLLELLLTQTGVNVNIADSDTKTVLMVACEEGYESIVRRLIQVATIDFNCRDRAGNTALHFALEASRPEIVKLLRGAGSSVDWNIRNSIGKYPLTIAVENDNYGILPSILSVPELDLGVTDHKGRNVAWIAVENDWADREWTIEILSQDRRVHWNIKNSDGDTPLMYCLKNNEMEKARCLINSPGVDLDTVDRDGKHLETIARERDLNILSLVCRANTHNIASRIPECPVCYERFRGQSQIFQCEQGHFVCGSCRPRLQICPTCRGRMLGRCTGAEEILQSLNI